MDDLDPDDPRLDTRLEAIRERAAYVADRAIASRILVRRIVVDDVPALLGLIARLRAERNRGAT